MKALVWLRKTGTGGPIEAASTSNRLDPPGDPAEKRRRRIAGRNLRAHCACACRGEPNITIRARCRREAGFPVSADAVHVHPRFARSLLPDDRRVRKLSASAPTQHPTRNPHNAVGSRKVPKNAAAGNGLCGFPWESARLFRGRRVVSATPGAGSDGVRRASHQPSGHGYGGRLRPVDLAANRRGAAPHWLRRDP